MLSTTLNTTLVLVFSEDVAAFTTTDIIYVSIANTLHATTPPMITVVFLVLRTTTHGNA